MASPAVPSSDTVTVDGYVVPSAFAKGIHALGIIIGAVVVLAPTVNSGWHLPSNLGMIGQYLAGGTITVGTLFSYMFHEKSNDAKNAETYKLNRTVSAPEIETAVTTEVLPFIRNDFPGFTHAVESWKNQVVTDTNAAIARVAAAVDTRFNELPAPVKTDIDELAAQLTPKMEAAFDAWWLKLRSVVPSSPTQTTMGMIDVVPGVQASPTEAVKIIGGDS